MRCPSQSSGTSGTRSTSTRWQCATQDANTDGDDDDRNEIQYPTHGANFKRTALADDSGNVIERYAYNPYGQLIVLDANFSLDADGVSDVANLVAYTGRRFDPETGFYYYRHRY